ncbi:MAG: VOC family protein [Acidimicrobiia bacterium]|nr:VOC family protein [Acidimicrobiia bacterium]
MARTEINAITLVVTDMARSVRFYTDLGFTLAYGGSEAPFTTFSWGVDEPLNFVNLQWTGETPGTGWGRVIFFTPDPDAIHAIAVSTGHSPEFRPKNAPWNERYFHIRDPDRHELSFAVPLVGGTTSRT